MYSEWLSEVEDSRREVLKKSLFKPKWSFSWDMNKTENIIFQYHDDALRYLRKSISSWITFSAHFQAIELDWQVEKWRSNEIRFDAIFQLPLNAVIDDPMEK